MADASIPVNLVTGFLGVGKTTALLDLLKHRPPGAKWAVVVNEFGEVGIDGAIFEADDPSLQVREVTGGCLCCTTLPMFEIHLALLLRDHQPERVLIETSGLAHPARILDKLRRPVYADRLDVRATLTILSPHDFANKSLRDSPVFEDQIQLADVLILNRLDEAKPGLLDEFQIWANALYPPKLLIAATQQGRLDPAWLDVDLGADRLPLFPDAHEHHSTSPVTVPEPPQPGRPTRHVTPAHAISACGWLFHRDDIFDPDKLDEILMNLPVIRIKGVFRIDADEWMLVQRSPSSYTSQPINYRRDSRVEIFGHLDWHEVEAALKTAINHR